MDKSRDYTAVVIAAGLSSRMNGFKPLLDIGGKPALFRLLDTIQAANIKHAFIVTGYGHTAIEDAMLRYGSPQVTTLHNEDYESGMFSSVQAGIRHISKTYKTDALLFPVDVPLVAAHTIVGLIEAYESDVTHTGAGHFAVPVHKGRNGHPLLIPKNHYSEIIDYNGDGGLKAIRNKYDAGMVRYEAEDMGCVLDMDTQEDYEKILEYHKESA
ncbi:MAG: nucleotidyltransferase family protein [Clostridiales bacterium]|nr:nucleotidyltransferase family protein [Clostridiales bacterium]